MSAANRTVGGNLTTELAVVVAGVFAGVLFSDRATAGLAPERRGIARIAGGSAGAVLTVVAGNQMRLPQPAVLFLIAASAATALAGATDVVGEASEEVAAAPPASETRVERATRRLTPV